MANTLEFPKIEQYLEALMAYNEHTNIYSTSAYDKLEFHINDCITMANIIGNSRKEVLDMGSGSGLPAVIIAICNPKNRVTAVESKSRKTYFLEQVVNELELNNLTIINQDINQYIREAKPKPDIITAKAFAPYERLVPIVQRIPRRKAKVLIPISEKQREALPEEVQDYGILEQEGYLYLHCHSDELVPVKPT